MITKPPRMRTGKIGDALGNDDQVRFAREAVNADERFRALMLDHHKDRYGVVTEPCTDRPRFVSARGLPVIRNGSPGALCAEFGSGEGRGQPFVRGE